MFFTFLPLALLFFNLPGGMELVIIVLIVLLFFGAKRIPELARGLGRGMYEFRKAADDIRKEIDSGSKGADAKTKNKDDKNQEEDQKQ
jgi:sec-independent protein translocase protein TatA